MKINNTHKRENKIYLAGGCFWGVEGYFKFLQGIESLKVGYANGKTENPTYEEVCGNNTGHVETLELIYDENQISLEEILTHFFRIINPYTKNMQGNDVGTQYRSGIYYLNKKDEVAIKSFISKLPDHENFVVEVLPLRNFYLAEDYHQDYLTKNPDGYCHINLAKAGEPLGDFPYFDKSTITREELIWKIGKESFDITQKSATETASTGEYENENRKGIYVDKVTGEPLFLSQDKFSSGCGWPSFVKTITAEAVDYKGDRSFGMNRIEVKSKRGKSHLGHVFEDGPRDRGGLRYCINSGALRFIPLEEMEKEGYNDWVPLVK